MMPPVDSEEIDHLNITVAEAALVATINVMRKEQMRKGHNLLHMHPLLFEVARNQANWMAEHMLLDHDLPQPLSQRVLGAGYYGNVGENIAMGFTTAESAIDAWYLSHGHRQNMLGDWIHIGVGVAADSRGRTWWCVVFGAPAKAKHTAYTQVTPGGLHSDDIRGGKWNGR